MNDLGFVPPPPKQTLGATPVTIVPDEDATKKPQYPSLQLNGEQAEKAGLNNCSIGQVYEITIRIKAKRLGGDSWEMRDSDKPPAQFDVISSDEPTEVESEEEDAGEDGEIEEKKTVTPPKSRILGPKDMKGGKAAYSEEE